MSEKLKTIIVDDEPIAIAGLSKYVSEIKHLELTGSCENAIDANELLTSQKIDLMFLDIRMPKMTGIQFLKTLKNKPLTIITSAFPDYAMEGYELEIIDYLLKPISFERFLKATNKAKDYFDLVHNRHSAAGSNDFLFVKSEKKIEKIFYNDILYIESLHNYVAIHTAEGRIVTYLTLKNIENSLPKERFIKIQKSFIVSVSKVKAIEENDVIVHSKRIPISRINKEEIIRSILGNNYLKR